MVASGGRSSGHVLLLTFDTPFPINYGGVYDVVARARYLRANGYTIDLLCVYRDERRLVAWREDADEQNRDLFRVVYAIKTRKGFMDIFRLIPTSVSIRDVPIPQHIQGHIANTKYDFVLVEHLKSYLLAKRIRRLITEDIRLRLHNDEHEYYFSLMKNTEFGVRKLFLYLEALKYSRFQRQALKSTMFSTIYFISQKDKSRLETTVRSLPVYLPIFCSVRSIHVSRSDVGSGNVVERSIDFLYVGNLNLDDNLESAIAALRYVRGCVQRKLRIVVCGRCDSVGRQTSVREKLSAVHDCDVQFNVSAAALEGFYARTKIFLNFSLNPGGVKTKLIEALSHGVLVLSNEHGVVGSGLRECALIAENSISTQILRLLDDGVYLEQCRLEMVERLQSMTRAIAGSYANAFPAYINA